MSMVMLTIGAAYGLGQHFSNLDAQQAYLAVMYGWINLALALVAIGLGKIAIIVFILQIQGYYEPRRSAFLWFMGASTLGINVITVILIFTQCLPIQAIWNTNIRGSCQRRDLVKNFGIFQTCTFSGYLTPAPMLTLDLGGISLVCILRPGPRSVSSISLLERSSVFSMEEDRHFSVVRTRSWVSQMSKPVIMDIKANQR